MSQRYMFQFINHKNGQRSEPMIADWNKLNTTLTENTEDIDQDHYILLVALLDPEDQETLVIPKTPLIKISSFLEMYSKNKETAENE